MDLSIIIVNWNSTHFLQRCLDTVYANVAGLEFETIVVDNASSDGCAEMLARRFPHVIAIQCKENRGFAAANNIGYRSSKGSTLLFLNPDTEIAGGAVQEMYAFLDSTPDAAAAGPTLLNSDGSIQTSCIQAFPSLLNEFLDCDFLRRRFPKATLWGMRPLFETETSRATHVDAVSGACLMIKQSVFNAVAGFSSDYFMYMEDIDLCDKVRRHGLNTYYLPTATVIHHGGKSSASKAEDNFAAIMMRESRRRYHRLRKGKRQALAYSCTAGLSAASRVVLLWSLRLLTGGLFRREALDAGIRKWVKVLRWACGMETWAKDVGCGI